MNNFGIKGRFRCVRALDGHESIFDNSITQAGLERILDLVGGLSADIWDSIRLVSSDPAVFVQKSASITRDGTTLQSVAVFPASELFFEVVSIQMYAGGVKVAEAPASLQSGLTYYVTREDTVSQGV
jgi:hypothetical protein